MGSLFAGYHRGRCPYAMSLSGMSVSLMAPRNINRQDDSVQDVNVCYVCRRGIPIPEHMTSLLSLLLAAARLFSPWRRARTRCQCAECLHAGTRSAGCQYAASSCAGFHGAGCSCAEGPCPGCLSVGCQCARCPDNCGMFERQTTFLVILF